jgi:hypothetical protein
MDHPHETDADDADVQHAKTLSGVNQGCRIRLGIAGYSMPPATAHPTPPSKSPDRDFWLISCHDQVRDRSTDSWYK